MRTCCALQVVGVVVAGAQHVGAEHDAPLHLGAEARARACARYMSPSVLAAVAAREAVAHAVVARQVRARLGRGDQVVDRDGVRRRAAGRRRRPRAPRAASASSAALERAAHVSSSTPVARTSSRGHADPQPVDVAGQRGRDSRAPARRAQVASRGSRPAITASSSAASRHGPRERPDLIERRGEGDQAVARHAAVGRLQADDAAEAPPAAGSIRRCRSRARAAPCPAATADGRPAARPARRRGRVPRVARRAERRVLGRRSHRELVAVGLADDDGAGRLEPRRRRWRRRAGRSPRGSATPAVVAHAARAEVVLDRDRHAGERHAIPSARRPSSAAARASARSAATVRNAFSAGLAAAIRARPPRHTSTAESPVARRRAIARAVSRGRRHRRGLGTRKSPRTPHRAPATRPLAGRATAAARRRATRRRVVERVRRRRHVGGRSAAPGRRSRGVRQLRREELLLVLGQVEPRERGDPLHVRARRSSGIGRSVAC